jgi:TrmH family RNA methyltransferase
MCKRGSGQRLLVLEDIQDPGNLGTMVRTAEAAGIDGIIMSKGCTDIFSPKVTRATMGAIFRVPFIYTDDLPGTLDVLKADGTAVYAAYLRNGTDYRKVHFTNRAAILIGNEGNGLSDEAVSHASENVFIPMAGEVESLNAAVAAAILMYSL